MDAKPLSDAEIAELERLEKAATPGPYHSECHPHGPCAAKMYRNQILSTAQYPNLVIADRPRYDCDAPERTFYTMLFIAAACNAIPRLLAELRELRSDVQHKDRLLAIQKTNLDEWDEWAAKVGRLIEAHKLAKGIS